MSADLAAILAELRSIRANTQSSMSIPDAAACIGVSDKTVAKWIAEGRIATVPHTGRRVLIARIEIDRFTSGRTVLSRVS